MPTLSLLTQWPLVSSQRHSKAVEIGFTGGPVVSEQLPKGWEQRSATFYFRVADGKACVIHRGQGFWHGIAESPDAISGYTVCKDVDPLEVIAALDLEYPMEARMARSDWKLINRGMWARARNNMATIKIGNSWMLARFVPEREGWSWQVSDVLRFDSSPAARDYADKHYPMEREG
jgi:hypothetical protein